MSKSSSIINKKIGIIGGGQLGEMMILDAKRLGFHVVTLDPTLHCPSHSISDEHIVAKFDDEAAILSLAEKVDVITYEFEHIGVQALKKVEALGHKVYPAVHSLEVIQNKLTQKNALSKAGIPVPDYRSIVSIEDIEAAGDLFTYPMMLKSCQGGYDGKGNAVIKSKEDVEEAIFRLGGQALVDTIKSGQMNHNTLMVESFVPYELEISVLACRGISGDICVYPVGENHHKESILDETIVPANISDDCTKKAMSLAKEVMEVFDGVGMFCVEMFVEKDQSLSINEVAPRPHNSGHYTIEGCLTSQFEQHIRAITGLPFGDVSLRSHTAMKNLLGSRGSEGPLLVEGLERAYEISPAKVHLYGKTDSKPLRKMGHITACAATREEALKSVRATYDAIEIKGINTYER